MTTSHGPYRQMRRIRSVEEALSALKAAGDIAGSVHLCNGQEAIPVGTAMALRPDDYITATYRGHGWALVAGVTPTALFAEVLGRQSGLSGGRGASPYFSAASVNFVGENSIVGAGVPIACGAALSAKLDAAGRVSVVALGDGATNQGAVHEGLNMAAILGLPLIVIVENNLYSEMTPISELVRVGQLAERGAAYGIASTTVDGNDPEAVAAAATVAADRARSGGGPSLIEAMTQRIVGHHTGDVQHYRPAGEIERARADEPLARLRGAADGPTSEAYDAIDVEVGAEIEAALAAARAVPVADPASLMEHVYV